MSSFSRDEDRSQDIPSRACSATHERQPPGRASNQEHIEDVLSARGGPRYGIHTSRCPRAICTYCLSSHVPLLIAVDVQFHITADRDRPAHQHCQSHLHLRQPRDGRPAVKAARVKHVSNDSSFRALSQAIARTHFEPRATADFLDLFTPVHISSESRARAFLWLCYHYHEAPSDNPYADGQAGGDGERAPQSTLR